jgi:hypothetical protein
MNLKDRVPIELEVGTLATLLSGLYSVYSSTDPRAIPTSVYIEIAEKLIPYLDNWAYDAISFEDWVKYCLLIAPKVMVEDRLDYLKQNELYFERENGNVILVISADMERV